MGFGRFPHRTLESQRNGPRRESQIKTAPLAGARSEAFLQANRPASCANLSVTSNVIGALA
jgi:hypothetical protein